MLLFSKRKFWFQIKVLGLQIKSCVPKKEDDITAGQGAIAVMNEIAKYVAFEMRFDFKRDMRNAVSTALARYRAEVLTYVLTQTSLNRART